MLQLTIPRIEYFDEAKDEFFILPEQKLSLEHSLVSMSKWESYWQKPFLGREQKTHLETIDYIRFMTLTPNVDYQVYQYLNNETIDLVTKYIENPMTATWFSDADEKKKTTSREIVTSEVIYSCMVTLRIPFECQKWHLNRLLTLIRVINETHKPKKKMSKKELITRNRALNEARRQRTGSKG